MREPDQYTITELAEEFSITTRAIRFYEDKGLLRPGRSGQNRIYSRSDRARLMLILRGKRLGFSLGEIGDMLDLYDGGRGEQYRATLEKVHERIATLERQRADIDVTLGELKRAQEALEEVLGIRDEISDDMTKPDPRPVLVTARPAE